MKKFITRTYYAAKLAVKANGPTIMVTAGVVSMTAGAVIACNRTLRLDDTIRPHVTDLDHVRLAVEDPKRPEYGPTSAYQDKVSLYTLIARDSVKLYAVPTVLFAGGTALVFGGHRIMLKRNATLAIAYTGLKKSFDAYRSRVVSNMGSDFDQGMMSGHVLKDVIDPETGKVTTVNVRDWDEHPNGDIYNRVFGQGESSEWQNDLGVNKMFIHNQQRMANILIGQRGHLYLCDVYKALGFEETDISRVVGWKVSYLPDGSRDIPNVNFGLDKPHPDDWKYNNENAIYLDFNCHGLIVGGQVQKALEQA